MKLHEDLAWRGLLKDKTFDNPEWLDQPRTFYLGIDASGDSLTIGNLAVLMLARRLADAGWQAVLLAGGATSLVGDPGGKTEERELKSREEIAANIEKVKSEIEKLFAGQKHEVVNNLDWLGELKYLDLLRDIGKHFPMNELMQREFVTERLSTGISYAEFSYSLLQGYDYWWLYKNKKTELQIGASDQWGNMLSGVALIRKKEAAEVHALSMPLVINKETGVKFGKSEAGAVWLDAAKTTPTQFYQFWMNVDDAAVEEYLKIYTFLSREEVEKTMAAHRVDTAARGAQKALAEQVTKLVHGDQQHGAATGVTKYLTSQASLAEASPEDLEALRSEVPAGTSRPDGSMIDALVSTGLSPSNSEARRLLADGAVYVNGQRIQRENFEPTDFQNGRLLLRRGKAFRDSALVELE